MPAPPDCWSSREVAAENHEYSRGAISAIEEAHDPVIELRNRDFDANGSESVNVGDDVAR
jgi:hypothetical protein